ncbi:MAG: precorrin-4 C(11)-methyltransferase [Deltaproteobacteria bacterium]|jgi:precorrin-4/cobalt-precorrin-4 C11-methyltransferase|nr:precorrin-4 C(11)-methyltransferase [Deltaproteobacteria bacterium]
MTKNNTQEQGKVWFIGAGPGDPELITLKGHRLISSADLIIYAGSLVPVEIISCAKPEAKIVDSSALHLAEIHQLVRECIATGGIVARVHTGDPSLYGALREQMDLLAQDGIAYGVIPGVTAAFAAAAAAAVSITMPETVQSFSITRLSGRTDVPENQGVRELAAHGGSLAVYLSGQDVEKLTTELRAAKLPERTPILAAYRVGWPEEKLVWTTLAGLEDIIRQEKFTRQTVFLVLPGAGQSGNASKLYDQNFSHAFRTSKTANNI